MDVRDELLRAAVDITRAASGLAAQRFLEGVPVSKKADGTEVTPADTEVEELIRSLIAARFPGDGVTGEELADTPGTTGRRWVIDPIDGTSAFALRIPMFNVLLAVEDTEGSAVSVISYPMSQDLIYAGRGLGCWRQVNDDPPQRITVSSARHPRGAWVEMVNPATWSEELLMTLHREVLLLPGTKGMSDVASGLTANLSRVLYAAGRSSASALAVSGGWLLVIVADLLIVPFVPSSQVVAWLGVGTTIGLTGSGVALLVLVWRFRGPAALRGCIRAGGAGLAGALAGTAAGLGVAFGVPVSGFLPNVGVTLLASGAVLVAFLAVVALTDGGDLRAVVRRVIRP
jgi:histidinol-phosphatase